MKNTTINARRLQSGVRSHLSMLTSGATSTWRRTYVGASATSFVDARVGAAGIAFKRTAPQPASPASSPPV